MTTNDMITELTQTVSKLQKDIELLKEDKNYLYDKLEKVYGDRVELRAENERLKNPRQTVEEEECLACSA
jgi:FtsZ-binding cell division protein ZapB